MKQLVKEINSETGEERTFEIDVEPTEQELAQSRIFELKQKLAETDYQAIKYAEGELPYAEYEPVRKHRREWRTEINRLEQQLNG